MSPVEPNKARGRRLRYAIGLAAVLLLSGLAAQQIPRFRVKEEKSREFFRKGVYFYNQRQYVAAREFFYKALDVQPSFHLARRFLGDAHYYSGEWNEALEQWELVHGLSGGAYPMVRQRSDFLRFGLYRTKTPGRFSYFREFTPLAWRGERYERPVDVAVNANGDLFVLSLASANLLEIDPSGDLKRTIRGPFYDRLAGPVAMAATEDAIYICDYKEDRIRVLHPTGRPLASFGTTGSGEGQLRGPEGVALSDKSVFVSDSGNRRIVRFSKDGKFQHSFGTDDRGQRPEGPAGMVVAGERLFVVDRLARSILVYDLDGNFLERIAHEGLKRPRSLSVNGRRLIVTDEEAGVLFYHLDERRWRPLGPLRDNKDRELVLNRPFSARMDNNGVLYLAEYGAHRIITIVPEGLRTSNLELRVERVDRRDFPDIAVFVTVQNRLGNPLRGLNRRRLRLYENDRRVGGLRTDNMKVFQQRANIAIVNENSDFLRKEFPGMDVAAIGRLVEGIRIADRLRLIRVDDHVRSVYEGLQRRTLLDALAGGETTKSPNLGKGLYDGLAGLMDGLGPRAVVLFVSGKEFPGAFDQYTTERIIQYAAANQIAIHVISCEGAPGAEERERARHLYSTLAERTGGRYMRAFDETDLSALYDHIRDTRDERYIITYRSHSDHGLSGRYVDVRVEAKYLGSLGKGNGGYFVP